jgi:hypothetical protein
MVYSSVETIAHSFHVTVQNGIAEILNHSDLPVENFSGLYQLGFTYSPLVVVVTSPERDHTSYAIAQSLGLYDLAWAYNKLSSYEDAWELDGDRLLISPLPSTIKPNKLLALLEQSKRPVTSR